MASGLFNNTHSKPISPMVNGNAGEMYYQASQAGMSVGQNPRPNSIISMAGYVAGYGYTGHTSFITNIETNSDGSIKSIEIVDGNYGSPSQEATMSNPMAYIHVGKYASLEDYRRTVCPTLKIVGFIYGWPGGN